jgi:transposase
LREHLIAEKVTCVVIESTSGYWKPFFYLLDDELNMMQVNASRVRNVPGRKTDVSDAAWLADLGAHGLVTASFVPPPPIRVLRDLTRTRTHLQLHQAAKREPSQVTTRLCQGTLSSPKTFPTGKADPPLLLSLLSRQSAN